MNNIKFSIITVVLNGVETIEQTIQSVMGQSYQNFEYIIIDGASTDGTLDVVNKYKNRIDFVISEKDSGIYDAMNKGINYAHGEYIGILNSDDWYENDALEKINKAINSNADVIFGDINLVYCDKKERRINEPFAHLWHEMTIGHPACFIKKEIYDKYGLYDTQYKIAADYDFLLSLYCRGVHFSHVSAVITNFRMNGISNTDGKKCEIETEKICEKYFNYSIFEEVNSSYGLMRDTPLYVFGAGKYGKIMTHRFLTGKYTILGIVDNCVEIIGKEYEGICILSPEEIDENAIVFISSMKYEIEIRAQISRLYPKIVVLDYQDFYSKYCEMFEKHYGYISEV